MSRRNRPFRLGVEQLESRRLLTAAPLDFESYSSPAPLACVGEMWLSTANPLPFVDSEGPGAIGPAYVPGHHDEYGAGEALEIEFKPTFEHEHDEHDEHAHEGHEYSHGIVLESLPGLDGATGADLDVASPAPITQVVTVQPIIVSNNNGSNTAMYFGNESQQAIIHDLIDQIWAQGGIDIAWLEPRTWNNTFANFGNGSTTVSRPTSDLGTIVNNGDAAGVGHANPLVLDMYFVEIAAGFQQLATSFVNGLAYVDANGSTLHVGDNLVTFTGGRETIARVVAHEIGHNLGLDHVIDLPNLMHDGARLTPSQITTALASEFSVPLPANNPPVVANPIADVYLDLGQSTPNINLATVFSDANGDTLTYSVISSNNSLLSSTISGGQLSLNFTEGVSGVATLTVTADDPRGGSVSDIFQVTVHGPTFIGDIDGNGSDDWISFENGVWRFASSPTTNAPQQILGVWSNLVTWQDLMVADFNGDGRSDVAGRANGQWWIGLSTGTSITVQPWGLWSSAVDWVDVRSGDFNGDGMADIAGRANGAWWLAVSNGTSFTMEFWTVWAPTVTWEDVLVGDFNGDGRDDIAGRTTGNWWIAVSEGTTFNNQLWTSWANVPWNDVRVGDFNGDGRDDIVGRTTGNWWLAKSTGGVFVNELWGTWSNAVTWSNMLVGDFNNDGREDILGRTGGSWWAGLGGVSTFSTVLYSSSADGNWRRPLSGDFNGDGRDDLASYLSGQLNVRLST